MEVRKMKMSMIEAYEMLDKNAMVWFMNDGFATMYLYVDQLRYAPADIQIKIEYSNGHFEVKASQKLMKLLEATF